MEVGVLVRDAVGQIFTSLSVDSLQLEHQLDQPDIVAVRRIRDVKNDRASLILLLTGLKEGQAILRVFTARLPLLDDYLKVTVAQAIIPSMATIHLGGIISFTTTMPAHQEVIIRNAWYSANEAVLRCSQMPHCSC